VIDHAATSKLGPGELTAAQRWILFAASLAVGLAFLDETAVVTALRTIQRQFSASNAEVQWVMGSYLLALASLMAATGHIADVYGRRRLFIVGAALFGLGSLACAASPNEEWLIASRALEGVGGALVIPLGLANATSDLPEERRGWVIGVVSAGATVFLALGPVIGGVVAGSWAGAGSSSSTSRSSRPSWSSPSACSQKAGRRRVSRLI
jgi:MFS family permease